MFINHQQSIMTHDSPRGSRLQSSSSSSNPNSNFQFRRNSPNSATTFPSIFQGTNHQDQPQVQPVFDSSFNNGTPAKMCEVVTIVRLPEIHLAISVNVHQPKVKRLLQLSGFRRVTSFARRMYTSQIRSGRDNCQASENSPSS